MSEFDKYFNKNFETGLGEPPIYILRHTFEAGQQSKQAEIDELRERIDEAIKAIEIKKPLMVCYSDALLALDILKGTTNEQ